MLINNEASNQLEALHQPEIIRESAFSKQLRHAAEVNDKSSFNLLLSMVCDDALELDQFHLPKSEAPKVSSDLYEQFFIKPRALYGKVAPSQDLLHNQLINQGLKASVSLDLELHPEPLIPEKPDIPEEVFDNLDINVRAKLAKLNQVALDVNEPAIDAQLNKGKEIDVEAWFNVLQQARALSSMA